MSRIVDIAGKEVGYVEGPGKTNKYGIWFGYDRANWCAMFVSWVYTQAGYPIPGGDWPKGFASVPNALKSFSDKRLLTKTPVAGDIVIFDWDKNGNPDHIGIFVKDLGNGYFESIEGNTSSTNPSDGGTVQRKKRLYKQVEAFAHVVDEKPADVIKKK